MRRRAFESVIACGGQAESADRDANAADGMQEERMGDSSISKIESRYSPHGEMGQVYLASGKSLSMRLWEELPGEPAEATAREYETVGYVIKGRAELESEGQHMILVPKGAVHRYKISEEFLAVEATSPPSQVHGRDEPTTPHDAEKKPSAR
jgi:quercetin dioxygenase-like cupin family protein